MQMAAMIAVWREHRMTLPYGYAFADNRRISGVAVVSEGLSRVAASGSGYAPVYSHMRGCFGSVKRTRTSVGVLTA